MIDLSEKHTETPLDSSMRLVCVKGVGNTTTVRRAFYEVSWKKWYFAKGETECNPICWYYLVNYIEE